jgi:uncharacterized membrane protein YbhN (UPF0104 family)
MTTATLLRAEDASSDLGVPRGRRVARRLLIAAALVLGTVEAVLFGPTLRDAVTSLAQARTGWVAVAMLGAALSMSMFARSRRRLLAAAGVRVPARNALAAVYVANAMHVSLPGGAAFSTAYTYRWMRSWGASMPAATWTLASGGVVSSVTLAGLGISGSLLAGSGIGLAELAGTLASVVLLVVAMRGLRRRPEIALAIATWVLGWVNAVRRRPPSTGVAAMVETAAQLRTVRPSRRDWVMTTLLTIGNWAFDIGCLAACAAALGVSGLSLAGLLIAYTAGMAASGLSLLPGGIGVVDAAMVLALVAGGIPAAAALPAVLLYRLISLVGVVAAGWAVAAVQAHAGSAVPAPVTAALAA